MKRVAAKVLLASCGMIVAINVPGIARADCGDEVKAVRVKLAEVKEEARREELQRLVDKAQKDADAGRVRSCAALKHAHLLLR